MHKRTLRLATLVCLLFVYQWSEQDVVHAGERLDTCLAVCDATADCFEECEVPVEYGSIFTICGEFEGGSSAGYCDHGTWDTCNFLCSSGGDGETACVQDGQSTDCEAYGNYLRTNDGICSATENCLNSSDCGACPNTEPPGSTGSAVNPNLVSYQNFDDACDSARNAGYGNGWDCPTDEWFNAPLQHRACSGKAAQIANINLVIQLLHSFALYPSIFDAQDVADGLALAYSVLADVESTPCYLFT